MGDIEMLQELKTWTETEINKIIHKNFANKCDAECLALLFPIYKDVICMLKDGDNYSSYTVEMKRSGHSMADKEIAVLEEKIKTAPTEYERKFYESLIHAAKMFNE